MQATGDMDERLALAALAAEVRCIGRAGGRASTTMGRLKAELDRLQVPLLPATLLHYCKSQWDSRGPSIDRIYAMLSMYQQHSFAFSHLTHFRVDCGL